MGNKLCRYLYPGNRDYRLQEPLTTSSQLQRDNSPFHTHQSESTVSQSENKESITILNIQDKLISAISTDISSIATTLKEYDFISEEVSLHASSVSHVKATILVNAVREKIKLAPKRFPELMRVFSEQESTKGIAEILQLAYNDIYSSSTLSLARESDTAFPSVDPQDIDNPTQQMPHQIVSDSMKLSSSDQVLTVCDSFHQKCTNFKDECVQTTSEDILAASNASESLTEEPHQVMLRCNDKLITALSADPLGIAESLLTKGLIPEHTEAQMQQCSTPREKATILVRTVRKKIEIAPKRFNEFISILSTKLWTKDLIDILQSSSDHKYLERCATTQASTSDQYITSLKQESVSKFNEDHIIPKLNTEDRAELEVQLILSAESMRKKFAFLLVSAVNSFRRQGIDPRELATVILAITEYDDPLIGKPLLERDKEALMEAKTIDHTFDILRPHMTFFNYEILEFLIEGIGSSNDKRNLQIFLQEFQRFCRRSVFEIPSNMLGHSAEKGKDQQKFCVIITKIFKAALLIQCKEQSQPDLQTTSSTKLSFNHDGNKRISAPELGISLEEAKHIQRKFASVLKLKASSIYLDSALPGSTILTFLLPSHISLAGLDSNPDIIALSSNGIHIVCGPPGKPEPRELTSTGLVVQWSQPEYGYNSLANYIIYYQKKCKSEPSSEWQKFALNSLETHTCVPDLSEGDTYIFKICTVSKVGTLQYSSESDPIILRADGILTTNSYEIIAANKNMLISAFSSADPDTIAGILLSNGIISSEDEAQMILATSRRKKAALLTTAIKNQIIITPEKIQIFLDVLEEAKLSVCIPDHVMEILCSHYYDSVYKQYPNYLKFLYVNLDKKQTSSNQWPPSATKKFFRLAMIKTATERRGEIDDEFVQMTITGKVDDILQQKCPIELKDIFKKTKGQRKVVLLEGAPGCGKSTLSVYICQQWREGRLFNQFKLIILVRLRDPAIKNANCLADLLPCQDSATAQQIETRIKAQNCQDILFILDGWDELPPHIRNTPIFYHLVQKELPRENPLFGSTVIVTSRPVASGELHHVVSSRVEILGFTAEKLYEFFVECLKGDTEAVKSLLDRIEENPEVAGSCYLPLNATILVHLFKTDYNTLPTTLYGIFSSLVLNCIKRHLKLRTLYTDLSIESLDQLPEFAKKSFTSLCRLAYDGVMNDKIIFTSLPSNVNTLSLLQGVESFIGREKALSHNFIHLSIQELLAAWYIATELPASEQVSKFNDLFNKSRFSAVFRFYAAITKLKTPGITDVLLRITCQRNEEGKSLLISLLHCLYEAQDPSLCESVAQELQQRGLNFSLTTLTPSDCLCIGYFLAHVCKMSLTAGGFQVHLANCRIDDQGCKYLVNGLQKCLGTHSTATTLLTIDGSSNAIKEHGVNYLSILLKIGCIKYLNLCANNLQSQPETVHAPFIEFAEQLKYNTTLSKLWLQGCGLNSQDARSLAEALTTNKQLEVLSISDNALCDDGIQHLAHALRFNRGLKKLRLLSCGMTDVGLECLAKSLQQNDVLDEIAVGNLSNNPNRVTEKIVPVLIECLQSNHTLTKLELPRTFKSSATSIENVVNDVRKRNEQPLIEVKGSGIF